MASRESSDSVSNLRIKSFSINKAFVLDSIPKKKKLFSKRDINFKTSFKPKKLELISIKNEILDEK